MLMALKRGGGSGLGGPARPLHGGHRRRLRRLPDRDAAQPSVPHPQVVAGRHGHAQDAEGAQPASGGRRSWSSTGATSIPSTGSPGTATCRIWSRGGSSTARSGTQATSGSGTRRSGSGPASTRPSTATCRSSAWRQPPGTCPPHGRHRRRPRVSAPPRRMSRPSSRTKHFPVSAWRTADRASPASRSCSPPSDRRCGQPCAATRAPASSRRSR
jgi:hypothetical protein